MVRVLVVEDDKFLGTAYRMIMTRAGFDFRLATDGEEAMETLAQWKPEVILLDIIMPRKDGFATLADIKKDPGLAAIPVFIASNLGQKEDLERATAMGADGFIIKSNATPDEIIARVAEAAGKAERAS